MACRQRTAPQPIYHSTPISLPLSLLHLLEFHGSPHPYLQVVRPQHQLCTSVAQALECRTMDLEGLLLERTVSTRARPPVFASYISCLLNVKERGNSAPTHIASQLPIIQIALEDHQFTLLQILQ